jgi:predicted ATPase
VPLLDREDRVFVGENAPEIDTLMPELRQRYDDIPEAVGLPPEQERRYLLHGVSAFVERTTRAQPQVLVFEDLHLADESTLLLLRHLAQRVGEMPVLVLGTYRHTELESRRSLGAAIPELLRDPRVEEMVLSRLDEAGTAALIEARAGKRPPPELVSLVYFETEGNPFFVEELFRHLVEAGKLFDDDGEFRSGIEIADTEVPRSVGLVLGHRLDRVGDTCRGALTAAAILGRTFRFDLVPPGTVTHAGAGGISHWIDFEHEIVGVYYEGVTEMSEMLEPISSAGHRFQDVITSAVVD